MSDRPGPPGDDERARLREDAPQLIGQSAGGSHIYYDEVGDTMYEGSPDDPDTRRNERPLDDAGVEGIVDTVNEREGWNWLSEFTQERLPDLGTITGDDADESG
ncbi:hypothetical protein [Halomarina rubra]|uniref:Uncharacterized protein n=1 Tax=Halomarina rubra TaxID=2071873 RepID=A0ABD6ATS9_9EURY|nr:hypothetical protein [Halomarina rubra]